MITYLKNTEFDFITNLKKLYHIAKANDTLSLLESSIRKLINISISFGDYQFALELLNDPNLDVSHLIKMNKQTPSLHLRLLIENVTDPSNDIFRKALICLTLYSSADKGRSAINKELMEYNQLQRTKFKISKEYGMFFQQANSIAQKAILAFLNPFHNSFPNNLPLAIRLKIALIFLQDEIPETIHISEELIKMLLIFRMTDYKYNYCPLVFSQQLTKHHSYQLQIASLSYTNNYKNELQTKLLFLMKEFIHVAYISCTSSSTRDNSQKNDKK